MGKSELEENKLTIEITELEDWLKSLPAEKQDIFYRRAARFFSSRELAAIMKSVRNGQSLFKAHKKAGVFPRHIVELTRLKMKLS